MPDNGCPVNPACVFSGSDAVIEQAVLDALRASEGNADALSALALIELALAESPGEQARSRLESLIDSWANALRDIDIVEIERLKGQFRAAAAKNGSSARAIDRPTRQPDLQKD